MLNVKKPPPEYTREQDIKSILKNSAGYDRRSPGNVSNKESKQDKIR